MTKRPADSTLEASSSGPHQHHPWVARGYRPEFARLAGRAHMDKQDPYGEVAYQRAFFDAIEDNSPRVPDPDLYHNSPSAKEYVRKRDKAIFAVKARVAPTQSSTQTNTSSSSGTPTYSPGKPVSPSMSGGSHVPPQKTVVKPGYGSLPAPSSSSQNDRFAPQMSPKSDRAPADSYRPYAPHGIPLTLEPKLNAPAGPSRMLR